MSTQQRTKAWKFLKDCISKVQDPTLRNVMMAEFRKRAIRDWGFNPDDRYAVAKEPTIELDDWEKEFIADINDHKMFKVDTRKEKREQTHKEAKARMLDFITRGGNLLDIPDDIRTDTVEKLYYECLMEYGDILMATIQ